MSELVLTQLKKNALWITLNRPKKFNAFTLEMYAHLKEVLISATDNDKVSFVVLTLVATYESLGNFADALAVFPKPVIALVNGPAIGLGVTSLGLMDIVICADNATFFCPFADFGMAPEAGSSRTLVKTMGHQKAAAMLIFAETFTAQEAYHAGLVTKILPASSFKEETEKLVEKYAKLSPQTLLFGKRLMRPENEVDELLDVIRKEEVVLHQCFNLEDTLIRLTSKFSGGSKL